MDAEERMTAMMDKPLRRMAYLPLHNMDREGSVELLLDVRVASERVLCCMAGLLGAVSCNLV